MEIITIIFLFIILLFIVRSHNFQKKEIGKLRQEIRLNNFLLKKLTAEKEETKTEEITETREEKEKIPEKEFIYPTSPNQKVPTTESKRNTIREKIIKKIKETDLEEFVGGNILSKIGIGIFVLGIAFFSC